VIGGKPVDRYLAIIESRADEGHAASEQRKIFHYSNTPLLRAPGIEDENDDEYEYEVAGEANRTPVCIGQLQNLGN
jgi:hypothetical protein